MEAKPEVHVVAMLLCDLCLMGAGGECHVPGCALYMSRAPDVPLRDRIVTHLRFEVAHGVDA